MKHVWILLFVLLNGFSAFAASFREYVAERNQINQAGDLEVIDFYQSKKPQRAYLIVDKTNRTASYYSSYGATPVQTGVQVRAGDELQKGGSGIYFYSRLREGVHYALAQRDGVGYPLFTGNIEVPQGTVTYVLPESREHRFRIRNKGVVFGAAKVFKRRPEFNYSPLWVKPLATEIYTDMQGYPFLPRDFARTLHEEKVALMELLQIEEDDYNMLAEFAFGVLSPETDYGLDIRYQLKQSFPVAVSLMKGNGFDTAQNSSGPTQVKKIPEIIVEKYGFQKHDLFFARPAAITTLAFAADLLVELRNMAHRHPEITEENIQHYLYYLYQGRRYEITNATATPDINIKIRQIREAVKHFHIEYK